MNRRVAINVNVSRNEEKYELAYIYEIANSKDLLGMELAEKNNFWEGLKKIKDDYFYMLDNRVQD